MCHRNYTQVFHYARFLIKNKILLISNNFHEKKKVEVRHGNYLVSITTKKVTKIYVF